MFRTKVVINKRRTAEGYISVKNEEGGKTVIIVHQDGGSRGLGQTSPADAPRTIVGISNTTSTPTILAARREMQRWRLLALEPSAMRQPDRFQSESYITVNGGHLPATLYRLSLTASKRGRDPNDVYAEVAERLSELVSVSEVKVNTDDVRRLLTLEITESNGLHLPASSLSDGTLRFLTLSIISSDMEARGVMCMEEPENGIHPAKIPAMVDLLRDIAVDPDEIPDSNNPLRQVIVATHSPYFVRLQKPDDLLYALDMTVRLKDGNKAEIFKCVPIEGTWRTTSSDKGIGKSTILAYLAAPKNTQLDIPFDENLI